MSARWLIGWHIIITHAFQVRDFKVFCLFSPPNFLHKNPTKNNLYVTESALILCIYVITSNCKLKPNYPASCRFAVLNLPWCVRKSFPYLSAKRSGLQFLQFGLPSSVFSHYCRKYQVLEIKKSTSLYLSSLYFSFHEGNEVVNTWRTTTLHTLVPVHSGSYARVHTLVNSDFRVESG